ncbi:e202bf29-9545-4954-8e64-25cf408e789f [Thermothielavioides terrestris]|uniref:Uncharacterized protein n=2 Tax=Thermothielavioides terrestris TaxID=2587410 RepID=G2REI8_THETT|nr:uncharacterized protein THITE_2122880 [Thermothielavioides terrestris NRRL 8126]AEO70963.1 hypothetical protein THITE_2122880 [Thermothielavioides terrestris NRRL 8126]SPQ25042.1 e202bf29-9545-4954-8e64-25cf408e789f [Thermothielavioides terrestris]
MDLGTVLTVVDVVRKAIAIYERIESLPQQMARLGQQMERINIFLVRLEAFVRAKPTTAAAMLYSGEREDLAKILGAIQTNAAKVYDLFDRYEQGIISRSMELEFRAKWMSRLWFSLVDNSPDKIQAIMEDMDSALKVLSYYLALMPLMAANNAAPALPASAQPRPDRSPRPGRSPNRKTAAPPPAAAAAAKHTTGSPPLPSPAPPRREYKVLFVDAYNTDRSVVAEALLKLFRQLTLKDRGDWPIAVVESAGFFVKAGSDCVDLIDGLNYSFESFKKPLIAGGQTPGKVPLAAVFDNKWCDFPFKRDVQTELAAHSSRGMRRDMFARFDFIAVFTRREHDNMIKLRAQVTADGTAAVPRGKGRVVQLGAYLTRPGGVVREILYPLKNGDGSKDREAWNRKVAEIKTALKKFLEQEMDWKQQLGSGTAGAGRS